ncbi:MAG: spore germination lipase LipC [Paenibacillus sp.]|jgi:lysophospholipase L1-like esterase|uniref:GDSL-type esterase/lipase family protein n=1 Tax=Paenibacillus sp. GCM10012303 TaxID=3317340 RepID=UPI0029F1642F|nr:spore germination lipase LipC [Paenibacillus sp.]
MKRELAYLAIGDSLTAGVGALPEHSFVHRYARLLETGYGRQVRTENAGISGATTGAVLETVRTNGQVRSAAERSTIITLTAGGNDLIQAAKHYFFDSDTRHLVSALKAYQRNIDSILETIQAIKAGGDPYFVRVLGLYNPLPEFAEAAFWVNKFNEHLRSFHAGDVQVIDVYNQFLGKEDNLLADDRFHPNAEGYRIIAEKVHAAGYPLIPGITDV